MADEDSQQKLNFVLMVSDIATLKKRPAAR